MSMNAALFGVLVLAFFGAGCSNNPTSPSTTTPPTTTSPTTETFSSVLTVNGATSHAFKVSAPGTVSVILTNLSASVTVGLGVGIPNANGAGCNLNTTLDATASSTAQITATVDTGTYCVELYDTGKLQADVSFAVQIMHP